MRRTPNNTALDCSKLDRSADFQVCCVAGFQTRWAQRGQADLEVGGTAGLETCATRCRQKNGFTLVEMMVVVAIVGIMSLAIVAEMRGTFQDALLRSTSRELAGACNVASSRAISINRPHRLHLDMIKHRFFLERSRLGGEVFYPASDSPGSSGTLDSRITIIIHQPGMDSPDDAGGEPTGNPDDQENLPAKFSEEAITFYPDGTADSRQIELTDKDGFRLALRINPVTSRVQVTTMEHLEHP